MLDKLPRFLFRISKVFLKKDVYAKLKEVYNKALSSDYEIVSLGTSCYPKTILTRHKLKKTRAHGEKTLPFDLAWYHRASFITEFVQNDFEGFFSDMQYIENIGCWDNFRKINFSHETSFGKEDKQLLIEKYKKRIESFKEILSNTKPVLFVQFLNTESVGEDVEALYEVLKQKRGAKPFELLVVDAADLIKNHSEKVNILKIKIPTEYKDLYDSSFYKSKQGKSIEREIITNCKNIIKNNLRCKVVKYL